MVPTHPLPSHYLTIEKSSKNSAMNTLFASLGFHNCSYVTIFAQSFVTFNCGTMWHKSQTSPYSSACFCQDQRCSSVFRQLHIIFNMDSMIYFYSIIHIQVSPIVSRVFFQMGNPRFNEGIHSFSCCVSLVLSRNIPEHVFLLWTWFFKRFQNSTFTFF